MQSGSYRIVEVSKKELPALRKLSIDTFVDTFSKQNNPTDIAAYLNRAFNENQLSLELDNPETCFYFISRGEEILGYLKINTGEAQSDRVLDDALEIERIYVTERSQGKGLGKLLMQFALDQAKTKELTNIWLGVWEKNEKAIAFYRHHGFEVFADHPFKLGGDLQRDLLMKRLV